MTVACPEAGPHRLLRFQGNESVRKTINNNIRYATDREEKAVYGQQLEDQIRQRRETEEKEKVQSREIARQLVTWRVSMLNYSIYFHYN